MSRGSRALEVDMVVSCLRPENAVGCAQNAFCLPLKGTQDAPSDSLRPKSCGGVEGEDSGKIRITHHY